MNLLRNCLMLALILVPTSMAQAQRAGTAINGVYNGTYTCAIGPRTLKLSLLASANGYLTGVFTFYLPPTSHAKAFSYTLNGTFDAASGKVKLNPLKWETPPPGGYSMVGMDGAFDPGIGQVAGKITYGSCGAFQAARDQAESTNTAGAIAPQIAAAAQPTPRVPGPPATVPKHETTSITGVYNGTYSCGRSTANLKLSLIGMSDGSVTGLFTIDPPSNSAGGYTYSVKGRYASGVRQFSLIPLALGLPAPRDYAIVQLTGAYVLGSALPAI